MVERILLGYDGTPAAVSALHWVAARAAREVAAVDVVTVLSRFTRERKLALEQLNDAEMYLRENAPGVGVELHRLEGGVIESLSGMPDSDLVVVGVNTGHVVHAIAAGALPLRIITTSRSPVVLVPSGGVDTTAPVTVGFSPDGSSSRAIAFAADEADAAGLPLRLVYASQVALPTSPGRVALRVNAEEEVATHHNALHIASATVVGTHPHVEVSGEVVQDEPAAALLRYALRSSLVVIGTHRQRMVDGLVGGSVAHRLLWRITCPLAVVGAIPPADSDDR
ncbi:universal stress protein [Microbacterium sp. TNHR37B]|uniref:universal stress protein n=1 Tax=Microbacterium sp. TNHR37B TaxID=1775956 RepID=UPI0007B31A1D|nr:universal stress protein [Microbacterium sp. TNHR37B]KZE91496.1 Universal stress protein [Microbacterium sp. TNHR37B]